MSKRVEIITRRRVIKLLKLDSEVLDHLEELQIVVAIKRPGKERSYGPQELDILRVYKLLIKELGVNPAGAEIILRMRKQLVHLRTRMTAVFDQMRSQGMLEEFKELLSSLEVPWD